MRRDAFREMFCHFPTSKNIFLRSRKESLSYKSFNQLIDVLEKKYSTSGLHPRELVAINTDRNLNPLEIFLTCVFLWRKGLTPVLIPPEMGPQNKQKYLQQVPCAAYVELFHSPMTSFELPELNEKAFRFKEKTPAFNPPAQGIVAFTSGSGGGPKGIHLTFANLYHSALGTTEFYHFRSEDEWALTLPPHHVGGFLILIRALLVGGSISLPQPNERWISSLLPSTTFISVVSTQLKELLEKDDKEETIKSDLPHLKTIILGGGPCSKELLQRAKQKNWPLYLTYGQTEMAAQVTSTSANQYTQGHAGPPLSGREIRISPTGEILLKGETRFYGHYQNQNLFRPFDSEGFFSTQDLGEWDENGNLIVKGRADRVFISGGENINPTQVEKKLAQFIEKQNDLPVEDFRLFPLPAKKFGQVPALYYRVRDNAELHKIFAFEEDLEQWTKENLLPFERPKLLSFDPRTLQGLKIQKREALPHLERQWALSQAKLKSRVWGDLTKPPLIFLHGFMGSHTDGLPIFRELLKKNANFFASFCLIGIDLPGHGQNAEIISSFNDAVQLIRETLKEIYRETQKPLNLWGYSMGGRFLMSALTQEASLSQNVKNLFIESASPGLETASEREKRADFDRSLFERLDPHVDPAEFFQNWYQQQLFGDLWKDREIRQFLLSRHPKERWQTDRERYQKALAQLSVAQQPSLWESLDKLPTPCHWIHGEEDAKYADLLAKASRGKSGHEQISLPGGHACHLESPGKMAEILSRALS